MRVTHAYTFYELQFSHTAKDILKAVSEGARSTKVDGNSHPSIGVVYEDHLFSILITEPYGNRTGWELAMWNSTGMISVGKDITFDGGLLPLTEMKEAMDRYISGKGFCAHCGKEIDVKYARSKGHSIYAGLYCDDCWSLPTIQRVKSTEGL